MSNPNDFEPDDSAEGYNPNEDFDDWGQAYQDSEWDPDEIVYEDDAEDWNEEDDYEAIVPGSMAEPDFDDGYDDIPWPGAADDDPTVGV